MLNLFNIQTKNINSAAFILGITSLISALLGLIRDRLLAGTFGAGGELDVYYVAFRIPDFINMVLIIGAIAAAITPIFSQHLIRSREEAFKFLSNLLNVFLFFLIIISIILIIFVPQIISLIAPGFSPEKKELTVLLTRIMFLSPILLGMSNIISSILRVFQRFLITSIAPILYNVGIIIGILFFVPLMGLQGLAWGVVLGGFLHLLVQAPALIKVGFKPEKIFNLKEPSLIEAIKLTIPRSIGLATMQINLIIITAIASTLSVGSIAIFNLAENLSRPLYTFIAVSFSTAAFPVLSLAFSKRDKEKFKETFSLTFNKILFLTLPLGLLFFLFKDLIVKTILQAGKFSSFDTEITAVSFGLFSLGIFAEGMVLLIAKAFYAFHDTKTPTIISIANSIFTLILCLIFVRLLSEPNLFQQFLSSFLGIKNLKGIEIVALPLAISLSATLQFLILLILFRRKRKLAFE
ncbi:MAG: murein biosynthesis integral membrane protein MurJ [Candidatus Nealsonbacteria bacterium CG08_land_8_20_14_0_20_38_20]|uniref:Probable lipid II flippase MurJ n=1 Tax=Candidatus Nealsonbacteria bacterium CG08_land_8_20_14_0_20_38_20 TaxID=1974705 RepID=A0A2H0YLQ4_9BACT|nr:MAG: murein biosynthesis integral membrane protein MurJ [Candidatus Nealsonbacteria bacterium CG08_land_8_20_14_0_20_38_20]